MNSQFAVDRSPVFAPVSQEARTPIRSPIEPMHLALIVEHFGASHAGATGTGERIAEELLGRGHHVTVFSGYSDDRPFCERLTVHRCGPKHASRRFLRLARWSRSEILRGNFDASLSLTTLAPAAVLSPRSGLVVEYHERLVDSQQSSRLRIALSPRERVRRYLERRTMSDPMVRRIITHSLHVEKQIARHYEIPPDRIILRQGGFDFPPANEALERSWRTTIRSRLKISIDAKVFLFLSETPALEGGSSLLEAMSRVVQRNSKAVLLIAGNLPYALQRAATELGVRQAIRMLGPSPAPQPLLAAADVVVHPTPSHPASSSVLMGLSAGLPVVTSIFDGASDWVDKTGLPGRVVKEIQDPTAVTEAMIAMSNVPRGDPNSPACCSMRDELSLARHVDALEDELRKAKLMTCFHEKTPQA